MKLLLCNDDGYQAEGLHFLQHYFLNRGDEVYTIAPSREQSGKSHSVTFLDGLRLQKTEERTWVIDGTPADCVNIGLIGLLPVRPDLVISGINLGYNIGLDILYSGTVCAAKEAVLHGIPALSLSSGIAPGGQDILGSLQCQINYDKIKAVLDSHFEILFHAAAQRNEENLPYHVINVNFPGGTGNFSGIRRTVPSCQTRYQDKIVCFDAPNGNKYLWIKGNLCEQKDSQLDTDIGAVKNGYVSISAVKVYPEDSSISIPL